MSSRLRSPFPWLVIAGVLVAALSMRNPIVAPTPVLRDISTDYGLDAGTAGLITTAPVLMFSLMTPIAALIIRRSGAEIALMVTLVGVLVGSFLRALPGFGWMLAGMVVIGAAITIGNVVAPVIIRRDVPPERVGLVTAAYTAMLNVGSLITSLATAPLASQIGWTGALLVWTGITVAGVAVWATHMRRERRRHGRAETERAMTETHDEVAVLTGPTPVISTSRTSGRVFQPITFVLMVAFGMQSAAYYALTTWLPTIASDELGLDATAAGGLASVFQGLAIAGAFLVPLLGRVAPPIVTTLVVAGTWVTATTGLAIAPHLLLVWVCVGAVAQAGGFVVIFATLATVARSDAQAAGMSAAIQGGGYVLSAAGAPIIGALHDASGGWSLPSWVLSGATITYARFLCIAFVLSRRPR